MSPEQIVGELLAGNSVFLTGAAGTGKSYTVNRVVSIFREQEREIITTSSTAASALHINGITTHKAFRLAIANNLQELKAFDNNSIARIMQTMHTSDWGKAEQKFLGNMLQKFAGIEAVVIDEVSMLSADVVNLIFYRLAQLNLKLPLLFVGDFLQLPPVSKSRKPRYAFEHKYWNIIKPELLLENKRSEEQRFTEMLQRLRLGKVCIEDVTLLQERCVREIPEGSTILCSLKRQADQINERAFNSLDSPIIKVTGRFLKGHKPIPQGKEREKFLKDVPCYETIALRKGTFLSCTVNIPETQLINGTSGVLVDWKIKGPESSEECPTYSITDIERLVLEDFRGNIFYIEPYKFMQNSLCTINGKARIVPDYYFEQLPVVYCWAITIHKAQGATLDKAHILCKGMFEVSQFYVAVSRVRKLENLTLQDFNPSYIRASDLALSYYKALEKAKKASENNLLMNKIEEGKEVS